MPSPLPNSWFQITLTIPSDASDAVSGLLFDLGSCGLQVEDADTRRQVRIQAYFESSLDRKSVSAALNRGLVGLVPVSEGPAADPGLSVADVPHEDWALAWRDFFKPVYPTPAMVVCPPWDRVSPPEGGISIVVEPKRAFGTGRHESTRLALRALSDCLRRGEQVLDVGTGSGILSAAAFMLGAEHVTSIDTDPQAVENAVETLAQNGLRERGDVRVGSVDGVVGAYDGVVANITAGVLGPMLCDLRNRTAVGGWLIFSGIVQDEVAAFGAQVTACGMRLTHEYSEAEWRSLVVRRTGDTEGDVT